MKWYGCVLWLVLPLWIGQARGELLCTQALTPQGRQWVRDLPLLGGIYDFIERHYQVALKTDKEAQLAATQQAYCEWQTQLNEALRKHSYDQLGHAEQGKRCALCQELAVISEAHFNRIPGEASSKGRMHTLFTSLGGRERLPFFQSTIEQSTFLGYPVSRKDVHAKALGGICGEAALSFLFFEPSQSKADRLNAFLDSLLTPSLRAIKRNSEEGKRYLKELFDEGTFDFHFGESLVYWDNRVLSIEQIYYEFSGGAHGNSRFVKATFDIERQAVVTLEDVFKDPKRPLLLQFAERKFKQLRNLDPNRSWEELGFWFKEGFYLSEQFTLEKEGMTFIYQPYEIAPYSVGAPTLTLTWQELKPYLKQEGIGTHFLTLG